MSSAIKAERLGKKYLIRHEQREQYTALRDVMAQKARSFLKGAFRPFSFPASTRANARHVKEDFWALKDVSFEVAQGETVGIIGRNGAGKSTLLKILSRITEPTTGRVRLKGRVASLLEVGTGFHPELTGRENIFLNGAILGMTKAEIKSKFDEIVDFAEIEKFLDTPVKRYSSGMYVRLAFAVAAHLEPEILLVDEVLAVGDAQFQKKCLKRMGDVSSEGRTVLFVSHNMAAVQNLCYSGMWLVNGKMEVFGKDCRKVIDSYQQSVADQYSDASLEERPDRRGSRRLLFTAISFKGGNDGPDEAGLVCGQAAKIILDYKTREPVTNVSIAIAFGSEVGENKLVLSTEHLNANYRDLNGRGSFECFIPRLPLPPGRYYVTVYSQSGPEILDWIREAHLVEVFEGDYFNTGKLIASNSSGVLTDHSWN
jgi:lipopolysaccharide transport system ATP-binding protein